MRRYRPKLQVIEALKKSAFLEVVEGKRIRRRLPLIEDNDASTITGKLKTVSLDPEGDKRRSEEKEERNREKQATIGPTNGYDVQNGVSTSVSSNKPVSWSNDRVNQPQSSRLTVSKPKGTGFEEFYTEGPVTPAEYEEEQDIYDM